MNYIIVVIVIKAANSLQFTVLVAESSLFEKSIG